MSLRKIAFYIVLFVFVSCSQKTETEKQSNTNEKGQTIFQDKPYKQKFAIRYYLYETQKGQNLTGISTDRNGHIHILSNHKILVPENGQLFYPGTLAADVSYAPLQKKNITALLTYKNHTVYLDDKHVFSNAWAGLIQIEHGLPKAKYMAAGKDFHFMVSDGKELVYINKGGEKLWTGSLDGVKQIKYHKAKNQFLLVTSNTISAISPGNSIVELYKGSEINCVETFTKNEQLVVGTSKGYLFLGETKLISNVPHPEITTIKEINGELWFGSTWGAFKLNGEGKYNYYSGERWLPSDNIIALEEGRDNSVLVLTDKGLGQINFKAMTLEEKALFYEKQVREKNIRYGFNCCYSRLPNGYVSAQMGAQASDNLWTSMYLASQLFRYKVTGDGNSIISASDTWLLPYWMGRYLEIISAPVKK